LQAKDVLALFTYPQAVIAIHGVVGNAAIETGVSYYRLGALDHAYIKTSAGRALNTVFFFLTEESHNLTSPLFVYTLTLVFPIFIFDILSLRFDLYFVPVPDP
jgi:hypothetical protein